jgi:hypothetical protein
MTKKSKALSTFLFAMIIVSLVFCGLGLTGYASALPFLNDVSEIPMGQINLYATPGDHTFIFSKHTSGSPFTGYGLFVGSDGLGCGIPIVGGASSATVSFTITDQITGYSVSTTESVSIGETKTVTLNVAAPYSPTPTVTPTNPPTQPTSTPITTPTSVNLYVDSASSRNVISGQSVAFLITTSPVTTTTTATLKGYVNGAEAFKQTVQLNAQGMGGAQITPSVNVGLYPEVTWIATVNGVSSNTAKTILDISNTPTPTVQPTQNPYATPYPSSTPENYIKLPIDDLDVNNEVAAAGAISSIVWALALVYYLRK